MEGSFLVWRKSAIAKQIVIPIKVFTVVGDRNWSRKAKATVVI